MLPSPDDEAEVIVVNSDGSHRRIHVVGDKTVE
jgi:hypothetical protein